ncbi:hypothetical protein FHS29_002051 [Saccharothrix tamanrassetensis]|uniref:Uncharacterized protein n=1 Tax=Saccharothrix tamanrassetensis TaxID=1051531 RepID=A0A841CER5_9PSEU|nr:hypothetical protein [Saccharothrix tamanrassetensis]MBB5955470.1 hypothetical protein [Saccharothrix tamanrassetensis]
MDGPTAPTLEQTDLATESVEPGTLGGTRLDLGGPAEPEAVRAEPAEPVLVGAGPTEAEVIQAELAEPEILDAELAEPEVVRAAPAEPEEILDAELVEPEVVRAEPAEPEAGAGPEESAAGTKPGEPEAGDSPDAAEPRERSVVAVRMLGSTAAPPGAGARDAAVARARAEVRELIAGRPAVRDKVVRSLLPPWLSTLHLGPLKAAGGFMVLAAGGSMVANEGAPWYFHLVDVLLLVLGLGALWSVVREVSTRRLEATRLRLHGPDEGDTIADAGVRLVSRPWWRNVVGWLFDLVVLGLPVLVAVRVWADGGWLARFAALVAVGSVVAASVYIVRSARLAPQWRRDFMAFEGMQLPPVRDGWDVLLR